jgi:rhamnosyltransferase
MQSGQRLNVAVLLATYNGARFIDAQIQSLKNNHTPFTLHWIDDHSEDATRSIVRESAAKADIPLREWHQDERNKYPGVFFRLLESVDADVYLFCDQDDIWQPGKIDATVEGLLPELSSPVLCFSDPLLFDGDNPQLNCPLTKTLSIEPSQAIERSRGFVFSIALGHTLGFTRALRDIVLKHIDIARSSAAAHDMWMHLIAASLGTTRFLTGVPTTLYRMHSTNTSGDWRGKMEQKGLPHFAWRWRLFQKHRHAVAKQAAGFLLAAAALPPAENLSKMIAIAKLLVTLERIQSPLRILRLMRLKCMPSRADWTAILLTACLISEAPRGSQS